MKIILQALILASLAAPAFGDCSLCPAGAADIVDTSDLLGFDLCGPLEDDVVSANVDPTDATACDMLLAAFNFQLDYSALCCKSVADPTDGCSFCPGEGSVMGNKGRELPPSDSGIKTCGDFDNILAFVGADGSDVCTETQAEFRDDGDSSFDLEAWCGCSGAPIPEICSFCGPDTFVADPERLLPDDDDDAIDDDDDDDDDDDAADDDTNRYLEDYEEINYTCGLLDSWAPYYTDESICEELSDIAATFCCEATPAADKGGKKGKKMGSAKGSKKGKKISSKSSKKGSASKGSKKGKSSKKGSVRHGKK
jgi:hypothetical protein